MTAVSAVFEGSTQKVVLAVFIAGGSIGGVPYPYFLRYLCYKYGIQWTFLIAGLCVSVTILLALLWAIPEQNPQPGTKIEDNVIEIAHKNTIKDTLHESDTTVEYTEANEPTTTIKAQNCRRDQIDSPPEKENCKVILRILLCNVPYVLFILGQAFAGSSFRVLSAILTDILRERGFSSVESTVAPMGFNFTGIPGRLLTGLIKKVPRGSSFILVSTLTCLASPAINGINFVNTQAIAILSCGICGLAFGSVHASVAVSIISLVEAQHYTPAIGIAYGLTGIIVAITGPLSGEYFRATNINSYRLSKSILQWRQNLQQHPCAHGVYHKCTNLLLILYKWRAPHVHIRCTLCKLNFILHCM